MKKIILIGLFCLLLGFQLNAIASEEVNPEAKGNTATQVSEEIKKEQQELQTMAKETLERLYKEQPELKETIDNAYAYGVFQGQVVNMVMYVAGKGKGVVYDNKTQTPIYMHAIRAGVGPGVGYKSIHAVLVFKNELVYDQFTTVGLHVGASVDASIKIAEKGGAAATAISLVPGISMYQLTNTGLVLQANWGATEFIKDFELNGEKTELKITCWAGYAKPYVDDFKDLIKKKYDFNLKIKISNPVDQDEFYEAAKTGSADLISPPQDMVKNPKFYCFTEGNFLLQTPNLNNIPNFKHILPFFQQDQALIHKELRYGVPYNCGPYGLAYNTAVVKSAPTSWNSIFDPQYKGQYTINNNFPKCNIWISALSLGYGYDDIFDISKLDRKKVQKRLNRLVKNAKSLWDGAANPDEFPELSLATTWGFAVQKANLKGGKWLLAAPKEGGTAWIDYWCITSSAQGMTKQLCEEWINFMLDPERQADVVHAQGVAPAVNNVGDLVNDAEREIFHVGDNDYFKTVALWQVMDEKTVKAFAEMWKEAKQQRK